MSIPISQFADKLNEVIPVVMRGVFRRQTNELCKGRITFPQFMILDFLDREGEARMTDMANFIGVTTAAMTGMVERLVKYEYVERVFNFNDRRTIKVKTTAKGKRIVSNINLQRRQMLIDVFGNLSGHDREEYLRILVKVRDTLSK